MDSAAQSAPAPFRVGISPDFFTDVKADVKAGVESIVARRLSGVDGLEWCAMPPQDNLLARPEALDQFDAILALALRINQESLIGVDRLILIARWGVGYDLIDTEALTNADVALAITPGAVRRPVAESIIALIFAVSLNLVQQDRLVRRGGWRKDLPRLGRNVVGRTLGSLGCGNIAQEMFRLSQSLGFERRIATDPYVPPERASALGVELVPMEVLFRESDYVCINTPLSPETRGLVGATQLRQMKRTAYLINTARGGVVDQAALVRALRGGWIAGAGLDVFEQEPLAPDDPLLELDNVVLAPHALAWTEQIVQANTLEACDNILAIARGEIPQHIVNREVLCRPGFQRKLARYRRQE